MLEIERRITEIFEEVQMSLVSRVEHLENIYISIMEVPSVRPRTTSSAELEQQSKRKLTVPLKKEERAQYFVSLFRRYLRPI